MNCPSCGNKLGCDAERDAGYCLRLVCGRWCDGRDLMLLTRNMGEVERALNDPANHANLTEGDKWDLKGWLWRAKIGLRGTMAVLG